MTAFRNLYASEITIRPTDTKTKGAATLLLYKDARSDMNILDETVGVENWQKEYYDVKGNLFCRVGIKTDEGWVWKADCGIESNVDAQKGEASDAFKRACVNWGIGRELYTGPRIKIKCPDNYYYNEHFAMTFYVKDIQYDGKTITELVIADRFDNIVFNWSYNDGIRNESKPTAKTDDTPSQKDNGNLAALIKFCSEVKPTLDQDGLKELKEFYTYWGIKNRDKLDNWQGAFKPHLLWQHRPKQ